LLNEEALARFQPYLKKAAFPVIYVVNSMGWKRSGDVEIFIDNEVVPVEKKVKITDLANGEEVPAQVLTKRREGAYWILEVKDIPAMGYKALKVEVTDQVPVAETGTTIETLENKFIKLLSIKFQVQLAACTTKSYSRNLLMLRILLISDNLSGKLSTIEGR
jgi:hypothetical protein